MAGVARGRFCTRYGKVTVLTVDAVQYKNNTSATAEGTEHF
jgi:hypothetical protein